jgi:putative tryptophan/tyrosine transport system substrate-binding protein
MTAKMKRREFITLLGGAAAAWPLSGRAQEAGRTYRIAILTGTPREAPQNVACFDELRRLGFIEGQNLAVDPRGFGLREQQFRETAATIVKSAPDAIVTAGGPSTRAAQDATKTIPILGTADDMVAEGLVASLARPGGNTTGVSLLAPELDGKRQDILMDAVPGARRMAALADPAISTPQHLQALQEAVRPRGVDLAIFSARTREEIVPAMNQAKAAGAAALNVLATPLFFFNQRVVIERAAALQMPAMYQWPEMAEAGGLAGYGPRITEWYRQLTRVLAKVLRGAKPADLPIEQPTNFELVINLQTAKAIGHEVPAGLVLRADKVIE